MIGLLLIAAMLAADLGEVERLIDLGELDRAGELLDESDAPEALISRLRGAIAMQRGDFAQAAEQLESALAVLEGDPSTSLYLAHAYVELGRPSDAKRLLPAIASLQVVAAPLVRARIERALGETATAYQTLIAAQVRFPESMAPVLELVAACAELGLQVEARRWIEVAARHRSLTLDHALALVDAAYDDRKARAALEALLVRFPDAAELRAHLAYAYASAGMGFSAGRLFESASALGAPYAFEAADQYRVSGHLDAALRMNGRVRDPRRRLPQRLAILFAGRKMARVVAMERELRQSGVWGPRDRYRVAYASYAVGNYQHALDLARGLADTEWRDSASSLIQAMRRVR